MVNGIFKGLIDLLIIFVLICLFISIHDTARWSLIKNRMEDKKGRRFYAAFTFPFFVFGSWIMANLVVDSKNDSEKVWECFIVTVVYLELAFVSGLFSRKYLLKDFDKN